MATNREIDDKQHKARLARAEKALFRAWPHSVTHNPGDTDLDRCKAREGYLTYRAVKELAKSYKRIEQLERQVNGD